jgi:hypothetical protein
LGELLIGVDGDMDENVEVRHIAAKEMRGEEG